MTTDPKFFGYFFGCSFISKNRDCLGLSYKRPSVIFTSWASSFVHFVSHVVLWRSSKKMLWIVAASVVACVAYKKSIWNSSDIEEVGSLVDSNISSSNLDVCVPALSVWSEPALLIRGTIGTPKLLLSGFGFSMSTDKVSMLASNPSMLLASHFSPSSCASAPAFAKSAFVHI